MSSRIAKPFPSTGVAPAAVRLGSAAGLPARGGVGLKSQHFRDVLETRPDIGFFEVHAENYMIDGAPELAAPLAATAEHLFPLLILIGLGTRFSALALLFMTLVIQVFVYPGAYATHATWAAVLLYLIARGPGKLSVDHWLARRHLR
jgi:uncharacterized membrane protein YphA (DoxX/SURF4 family)